MSEFSRELQATAESIDSFRKKIPLEWATRQ